MINQPRRHTPPPISDFWLLLSLKEVGPLLPGARLPSVTGRLSGRHGLAVTVHAPFLTESVSLRMRPALPCL